MRRKLISQRNSHTLTLPIKWVRDHGLDKNEEVELEEEREGIFVRSLATPKKEKEITMTSKDDVVVRYILNNLYRGGYDQIKINYSDKAIIKIIENHLEVLLGWQISGKTDKEITIENLTEPTHEKFDILLRRMFFIIQGNFEILEEYFDKKSVDKNEFDKNDKEIVKLDNFCRRCISKRVVEKDKTLFYWQLISTLTWMDRDLYYLFHTINKNKLITKGKPIIVEKLSKAFDLIHDGFYQKDLKKIESVFDIIDEINSKGK